MNAKITSVRVLSLSLTALVALAGCQKEKPAEEPKGENKVHAATPAAETAPAATAKPVDPNVVTVLITADENGHLLPTDGKGGAAELLGKWKAEEGHCAPVGSDCAKAGTIAVSTGDHWGGPSISSFFFGEPTAHAMNHLGYAASGFGNHELDFGNEQFLENKQLAGAPYVAANLKVKAGGPADMQMPAHVLVERNGHKVAIVGLSHLDAAKTTMSGRFEGLEVTPYETALTEAVPAAWTAGAEAVVVVADVCPTELEPIVAKHADWKLAVVAGGHCADKFSEKKVGNTWFVSPGRRFESYARAKLTFDPAKPAAERLTRVDGSIVKNEGGTPDAALAGVIAEWKAKNDKALGEEIGYTKTGLAVDSPELGKWITRALRANLQTDAAIVNKKGIRQGLAPGAITMASVYSVIPFENSALIVKLKGSDLQKAFENPNAVYSGFNKGPKGYADVGGKLLDPKKTYSVATVEYLYFGGDGFEFEKLDEYPMETGRVWQTPVISWTKAQKSGESKPLERMLK